jgi:hypothetical protein
VVAEPVAGAQLAQQRFPADVGRRAPAKQKLNLPLRQRRLGDGAARDRQHRRQAGAAGDAQNVAGRVAAQPGHAVGPVQADPVPDRHAIEQRRATVPARLAPHDEFPHPRIGGRVAHRISAAANDAGQGGQRVLAGLERLRLLQHETEFAHVMGQVAAAFQHRVKAMRRMGRLVARIEPQLERAVGAGPGLAAEVAFALPVLLAQTRRLVPLNGNRALDQLEPAVAAGADVALVREAQPGALRRAQQGVVGGAGERRVASGQPDGVAGAAHERTRRSPWTRLSDGAR